MKQILFIFTILFILTGCSSDESEPLNVEFSSVFYGDHFSGDYTNQKANLVVKNQKQLDILMEKYKLEPKSWENSMPLNIDFKKYQIIAVIDQVRNYSGYSIDITKITQTNNRIFVQVKQLKPGGLGTVITQPYHIVQMPKSNKKVVFE
ncbi:protease complex subunit PrcB family protein [Flavobacterium gelatinilyticum]|uniref:protease complex subunit PrcB family protein n=1 Tax=Flavobacterium gelatinilyticum TaxID=3003260 RepID=UPI002480475A|nr:protease complex subunit PrcB family protein [Flavobacterium gelatinilyticum]